MTRKGDLACKKKYQNLRIPESRKKNEFLTPLLYMPCKLERNGININCMLTDEFLSLNTGALT